MFNNGSKVMRTEQVSVYKYEELSEEAKAKARDWYRADDGGLHDDWWDAVYEDAGRIFDILGIDSRKPVKLMNGSTRHDPAIWFTGFGSQGDGACFTGTYAYKAGSVRAIKRYAPEDAELQRIASELMQVQRSHGYKVTATLEHRDNYYHENSVSIDVDWPNESYVGQSSDAETVRELLRDLMRWIYRALEKEHEYLTSDESVAESIIANEYEFEEDGSHYV
jgi:hypothetical protein